MLRRQRCVPGWRRADVQTYPSSSPYITQVGGTTLSTTGGWRCLCSERFGTGDWTTAATLAPAAASALIIRFRPGRQGINSLRTNGGSTTMRNIPDVALTATMSMCNTATAAPAVWRHQLRRAVVGGFHGAGQPAGWRVSGNATIRSASSIRPFMSWPTNPFNVRFSRCHDWQQHWSSSPNAFYAVPGYDLCTGLGTPARNKFDQCPGRSRSARRSFKSGIQRRWHAGGNF